MLSPYDRERRLMPILTEATRRGVRLDRDRLMTDTAIFERAFEEADEELRTRLGDINLDASQQVHKALWDRGLLTHIVPTPTGKPSTARKVLIDTCSDAELVQWLVYRGELKTCLGTFCRPWLTMSARDGRLHPEWNQVRSDNDRQAGARTGRLSSSRPNFQNIPTEFNSEPPPGMPTQPVLRQYVLPDEGHVWLKRDFSAQEIRIAAHFENGELMHAFQDEPTLDPHQMAKEMIHAKTGQDFDRKHVKITGFQILYGGGIPAISSQVGCSAEEANALRRGYLGAMPGVQALQQGTKHRGRIGRPIYTWGGRKYYVEPPKLGRTFEYKLLNYLVQGSAADQTKQCIIDWDEGSTGRAVFLATVHDEINISAPEDDWEEPMARLKSVMEQPLFDVPMLTEGFVGTTWHDIVECE